MEIKETDLAWLAGLADGESCVRLEHRKERREKKGSDNYRLVFEINMVHKDTILRIIDILKVGTIIKKKSRRSKDRVSWVWRISCTNAKNVLNLLYPYVVTKKKEFEIALRFIDLLRTDKKDNTRLTQEDLDLRESLYKELQEAKRYEWKD